MDIHFTELHNSITNLKENFEKSLTTANILSPVFEDEFCKLQANYKIRLFALERKLQR